MNNFQMRQFLFATVACAAFAGCALGPDYRRPVLAMPAVYPDNIADNIEAGTGRNTLVLKTMFLKKA